MREATAAKIQRGPAKGSWGARVEGNPKPEIGEVVHVVRSSKWDTYEKLTGHIWAGRTREGEIVRVYTTVPAGSEIGQVTAGEIKQFGVEFQEIGRLLVEGKHRAAGQRMIDFGLQVEAGYQEPEDPAPTKTDTPADEDPP